MSDEDQQYDDPSLITEESPVQTAKPVHKQKADADAAPEFVSFSEFKHEIERQ